MVVVKLIEVIRLLKGYHTININSEHIKFSKV